MNAGGPATQRPLRLLVVDDEPLARLRLRGLLQACAAPPVELAGEAADAAQTLALLESADAAGRPVDLLLLDIRMPGPSGLQLAAALARRAAPPAVVFVTAHGEHALTAFELQALGYLTKPVRAERLQAALQRAWALRRGATGGALAAPVASGPAAAPPAVDAPVLVVHERGRVLRLPLPDVLLLRAADKRVSLHTAQAAWPLDEALADLEQRLAALGGRFVRTHRSTLVAVHAVRALERHPASVEVAAGAADEGWALHLPALDEWVAVSRRQLAAVRAAVAAR